MRLALLTWVLAVPALAAPRLGSLLIVVPVDGAVVEVDGKHVGKTPLKPLALPAGTHKVKVRKPGFLDFVDTVQVEAGKRAELAVELLSFGGILRVTANVPGAQVQVDGKPIGKAPVEHEVKAGRHTVVVTLKGHNAFSQVVETQAGRSYEIAARLAPRGTAASADMDLELEPLVKEQVLAAPLAAPAPLELAPPPAVEAVAPWYQRPWAWGTAAAVVATGVVAAVLVTRDGKEPCAADVSVVFGQKKEPCR